MRLEFVRPTQAMPVSSVGSARAARSAQRRARAQRNLQRRAIGRAHRHRQMGLARPEQHLERLAPQRMEWVVDRHRRCGRSRPTRRWRSNGQILTTSRWRASSDPCRAPASWCSTGIRRPNRRPCSKRINHWHYEGIVAAPPSLAAEPKRWISVTAPPWPSSPLSPTPSSGWPVTTRCTTCNTGVTSSGRAASSMRSGIGSVFCLGPEGRRFDSFRPDHFTRVSRICLRPLSHLRDFPTPLTRSPTAATTRRKRPSSR